MSPSVNPPGMIRKCCDIIPPNFGLDTERYGEGLYVSMRGGILGFDKPHPTTVVALSHHLPFWYAHNSGMSRRPNTCSGFLPCHIGGNTNPSWPSTDGTLHSATPQDYRTCVSSLDCNLYRFPQKSRFSFLPQSAPVVQTTIQLSVRLVSG